LKLFDGTGPYFQNRSKGLKVVYKRYASLYFAMFIDPNENELDMFNIIHSYVELLDKHFGSVCELDIVFEFQQAYRILDELIIAGHLQESSQEEVRLTLCLIIPPNF